MFESLTVRKKWSYKCKFYLEGFKIILIEKWVYLRNNKEIAVLIFTTVLIAQLFNKTV